MISLWKKKQTVLTLILSNVHPAAGDVFSSGKISSTYTTCHTVIITGVHSVIKCFSVQSIIRSGHFACVSVWTCFSASPLRPARLSYNDRGKKIERRIISLLVQASLRLFIIYFGFDFASLLSRRPAWRHTLCNFSHYLCSVMVVDGRTAVHDECESDRAQVEHAVRLKLVHMFPPSLLSAAWGELDITTSVMFQSHWGNKIQGHFLNKTVFSFT